MDLIQRIRAREARLGVIGLGYVGLPLLVEFARAGFDAVGIDVDPNKVDALRAGRSYVRDVSSEDVERFVGEGRLHATTDFSELARVDSVNICVPTPLRKTKDPDISYIVAAVEEIAKYVHEGQLVILESTTYPGTTEEVILPRLERDDFRVGEHFFLAFSPERVDPGNPKFNTRNIPKVVGGVTPRCTEVASALYEATLSQTVPVSSARVAETVKLLENTFRSVNIGLVNEIALMCHRMDIDVWEVIRAAATKPFGFMPFYPGPGLGGHCIPIDPFYLSWKARMAGFEARFIELAGQINGSMPGYVVDRIAEALNDRSRPVRGSRILVVGIAYKADIDDLRESPALDVIELLRRRGADVVAHDPWVDPASPELEGIELVDLAPDTLSGCHGAVVTTGHSNVDYDALRRGVPFVLDTRNVYEGVRADNIIRL